jgi:hypothetical protein
VKKKNKKKFKKLRVLIEGQSFPANWVEGISFNLLYKNDMCPLNM